MVLFAAYCDWFINMLCLFEYKGFQTLLISGLGVIFKDPTAIIPDHCCEPHGYGFHLFLAQILILTIYCNASLICCFNEKEWMFFPINLVFTIDKLLWREIIQMKICVTRRWSPYGWGSLQWSGMTVRCVNVIPKPEINDFWSRFYSQWHNISMNKLK